MSSHPRRSSSIEEGSSSSGTASSSSGGGGLHHRRVASNSLSSLKLSTSPRPPLLQHQVSYSKNKDHENGSGGGSTSFASSSWLSLQYHKLLLYRKKLAAQKTKMKWVPHLIILAAFMMIMLLVTTRRSNNNNHLVGSSIFSSTSSIMRCSSFLRSLKHQSNNNESPQSRLILMASHLRHGPDGEMRLRIIEHNLRLLAANEPSSTTTDDHGDSNNAKQPSKKSPLKAILLFSIDTQSTQSEIQTMINTWRNQISQNNDKHNVATNIISQIIYVPNDTTMVDASKWIVAIDQLLPEIQSSNSRVMLINDSFVLTRPVPELWDNSICGEVCGLVWTASKDDPRRHIQSYVRTLSSCAVERYRRFYRDSSRNVHNVHELIEKFEMNLDWVDGGGGGVGSEGVKALFEFVGAHPDADEAQKVRVCCFVGGCDL
jgi:hypothetical protein